MAYAKRYVGGFIDKPTQTTPVDSTFLNAVEAALLKLYALDPNDAQVMAWVAANARFEPKLLTNANIDPAAAIAKSKLASLQIVDADVAGAAAIAQSKIFGLSAALAGIPPADGWTALPALTWATTDGHTFTATYAGDVTGTVPVGARIKVTHAATTKYFIVTAHVAGTLTLYGGTTYTLDATAITNPFFSREKSPVGFPLSPTSWTEEFKTNATQSVAPVSGTWYNLGSYSLTIPIGAWDVEYFCSVEAQATSNAAGTVSYDVFATLSTGNSTESDSDFTASGDYWIYAPVGGAAAQAPYYFSKRKSLLLAVKTQYFLNEKWVNQANANCGALILYSSISPVVIRARCAYL